MADSIRKLIFKNLETVLQGVGVLQSTGFGLPLPITNNMPSASVVPMDEITETHKTGPGQSFNEETLSVAVRVQVDQGHDHAGYELEDVILEVHRAVLEDERRGGYADSTRKTGTKWLYLGDDHPQAGADILFEIAYQTAELDPASINP